MFTGIRRIGTSGTHRVALAQTGLASVVALAYLVFDGGGAGLAALYGGMVAVAVSVVLVLRERQSMRHPEWDQHQLMKLFIRAGMERLAILLLLLTAGLGLLKLAPLPLLVGLLLAQFGWLAATNYGSTR
jgi:ATP synthase protein I